MGIRPFRQDRRGPAPAAAEDAIARFLDAMGLPADVRSAADLADTPRRVAETWLEDLVDGYGRDPADVLAGGLPSAGRDLVAVTGIDYHSVCPHHLLPSRGVAHVAYVPGGKVVGFGQIVKLVDALAHRLVLEEDLAREIAEALVDHVGARGAACVLEAEQLCMTVRGEKRPRARAHAESWLGALARTGTARRRFVEIIAQAGRGRGPGPGRGRGPGPGRGRGRGPGPARGRGRAAGARSGTIQSRGPRPGPGPRPATPRRNG